MLHDSPSLLQQYIRDCRTLCRELEQAIDDLEFMKADGKIYYAVDFSEIHAYALPRKNTRDFLLFAKNRKLDAEVLQRFALRRLFDDQETPLVLLKPYVGELQTFLVHQQHHTFDDIAADMHTALYQLDQIQRHPDFARIMQISTTLEAEQREPNAEEQAILVPFLVEEADQLMATIERRNRPPLERVRNLFTKKRFTNLSTLIELEPFAEEIAADQWYEYLVADRKEEFVENTLVDAMALAFVEQANLRLKEQKTRLLLVTRSSKMHAIFAPDYTARYGQPGAAGDFLRHPRIFNVLYTLRDIRGESASEHLEDLLKMIRLFLESVQDQEPLPAESRDEQTIPKGILNDIEDKWLQTESLAASLYRTLPESSASSWEDSPADIRRILTLLRDRKQLRQVLISRLDDLAKELERDHEAIAFYLYGLPQSTTSEADEATQAYIIRTTLQALPYKPRLYTPAAQNLFHKLNLENHRDYSWTDIINMLREGFSEESDYERVLVMACMFGTFSKWNLAELYCRRAIELAEGQPHVTPHEGLFFLAVCMRKQSITTRNEAKREQLQFDRHIKALELIEQARSLRRRQPGATDDEDPRYLKEMATHILTLNIRYRDKLSDTTQSAQDGLDLLFEAERLSHERDPILTIHILNNRVFYYVFDYSATGNTEVIPQLRKDFAALVSMQEAIEPDWRKWPAFVLDTIAWASWHLHSPLYTDDQIVQFLQQALESRAELTDKENESITYHLGVVTKGQRPATL